MTDLQATILEIGLPTCFSIHIFCEIYYFLKKKNSSALNRTSKRKTNQHQYSRTIPNLKGDSQVV